MICEMAAAAGFGVSRRNENPKINTAAAAHPAHCHVERHTGGFTSGIVTVAAPARHVSIA